jgi:hypothetical protein
MIITYRHHEERWRRSNDELTRAPVLNRMIFAARNGKSNIEEFGN